MRYITLHFSSIIRPNNVRERIISYKGLCIIILCKISFEMNVFENHREVTNKMCHNFSPLP